MKSERRITLAIMKALRYTGWWVVKMHGNVYQRSGLPDLVAERPGQRIWIEVKQPGKKPTMLQLATHQGMRNHGCTVLIASSPAEVLKQVSELGAADEGSHGA